MEKNKKQIITTLNKEWSDMSLGSLTAKNIDFFIAILSLYQKNPQQKMIIPFRQLQELTLAADENNNLTISQDRPSVIKKSLEKLGKQIIEIYQKYRNEKGIGLRPVFIEYFIPYDKDELHIEWHPAIIPLIEHLTKDAIYIKKDVFLLSSSYSKCLYIMLREFDNTKSVYYDTYTHRVELSIPLEELHQRLGTPKSYQNGTNKIYEKILNKQNMGELRHIFNDLIASSVKADSRSNKTVAIRFSWIPSTMVLDEQQKQAIQHKSQGTYTPSKKKWEIDESPSNPKTKSEWEEFEEKFLDN